jgi:hypothetical protein
MMRIATHLGRGEHAAVVGVAAEALESRPDDTVVMAILAASYDRLGQDLRAVTVRERLLALRPDDKDALYLLGRYHEQHASAEIAAVYYSRYLESTAKNHPLADRDYRFLRFLARLFGTSPSKIESDARTSAEALEREERARRTHVLAFLVRTGGETPRTPNSA